MNQIRYTLEASKSPAKVCFQIEDDADEIAQKQKLKSTYTFGS